MADKNYDPNARYDIGTAAAGAGRATNQPALQAATVTGLGTDGTLGGAELSCGRNAAGVHRKNAGPNVAGAPRSVNGT